MKNLIDIYRGIIFKLLSDYKGTIIIGWLLEFINGACNLYLDL